MKLTMTNKYCKYCYEIKSITEFKSDKKNKSGYANICKLCSNLQRRIPVLCSNCNKCIAKSDIAAHKKTKRCIEGDKPWKHFKPNGKEIGKCPCKSPKCYKYIVHASIYRHLKYGIDRDSDNAYLSPIELTPAKISARKEMIKTAKAKYKLQSEN